MPNVILSAVGTSLFTNLAGENRKMIVQNANASNSQISEEIRDLIYAYQQEAQTLFENNDFNALKRVSAELNSLITYYNHRFEGHERDVHLLVSTDTFLGKEAAKILEIYLEQFFDTVYVYTPRELSTRTKEHFQSGIRDLLKWCDEDVKNYKDSKYNIIFNLTGGFKSLQGYLNTIGMFYADEIIYIFEQGGELISIPRLPIQMETGLFEQHASLFLQLSQSNDGILKSRLEPISEILIEEYENDRFVLSNWGELSWNNVKQTILEQRLIDLPLLEFLPSFKKDFQKPHSAREKVKLQETMAKISCLLQENNGDIACLKGGRSGGILYKNYSGNNVHLGHFRVGLGPRGSCEYKNNKLLLRHFGEHDYVNNNP